jgi:hypothetical protein
MSTQRKFRKYFSAAALLAALIVTDGWLEFMPPGAIAPTPRPASAGR